MMIRHFALGVLMLAGAGATHAEESFADSVSHASPLAAAEDFVASMADADFFRAYFLLSPQAKDAFQQTLASGRADALFPGQGRYEFPHALAGPDAAPDLRQDIFFDASRTFDDMLAGAMRDGALPFSFAGAEVTTVSETEAGAIATIAGGTDGLTLDLSQTEWDEWRVDAIAWNGGASERLWSVGPEVVAVPPADLPQQRTYLDGIDFSTPEAVIEDFIRAFADADYFRAYFLLDLASRAALFDAGQPVGLLTLVPGIDRDDLPGTGLFRDGVERADALALDTMRDPAMVFHRLLAAAKRQGVLPFELDNATLKSVADGIGSANTGGDPLTFRMTQMPDGQWRIAQITWPGSNEMALPWGGDPSEALRN